jgi:hypothetical protein
MHQLASTPNRDWKALPRSSKQAAKLGRRYYFSGEPCRNGHVAPAKVRSGCIICMGLSKARAEVRLHERIAQRELDREGAVRRPLSLVPGTCEVGVLIAVAERKGIATQAELVGPGMSKASVSRALRALGRRKLIETRGGATVVTLAGWVEAQRLGAALTFRQSEWRRNGL